MRSTSKYHIQSTQFNHKMATFHHRWTCSIGSSILGTASFLTLSFSQKVAANYVTSCSLFPWISAMCFYSNDHVPAMNVLSAHSYSHHEAMVLFSLLVWLLSNMVPLCPSAHCSASQTFPASLHVQPVHVPDIPLTRPTAQDIVLSDISPIAHPNQQTHIHPESCWHPLWSIRLRPFQWFPHKLQHNISWFLLPVFQRISFKRLAFSFYPVMHWIVSWLFLVCSWLRAAISLESEFHLHHEQTTKTLVSNVADGDTACRVLYKHERFNTLQCKL